MELPDFISDPKVERYYSNNYVCLDFEIDTSYGDYGHPVHPENQMLLACWSVGEDHPAFEEEGRVYTLWANEYGLGILLDHLRAADLLIAQNAKYELGWLLRCGFDISSILVYCTQMAEYVLCGNMTTISKSLGMCMKRRGRGGKDPVVDRMMKRGINPVHMPRKWLSGRCIQDVQDTEWLFKAQLPVLAATNRLALVYTRSIFSPLLADMERQGCKLDADLVRTEHRKETINRDRLAVKLQQVGDINWNSKIQIAEFIYGELGFSEQLDRRGREIRTPAGKPKTDGDTILTLKARTPQQKAFMKVYADWNKSSQRLSKYLDFYLTICDHHDGVFYAEFNQSRTKTHRLSSSGMRIELIGMVDSRGKQRYGTTQLQNQPNEYKKFFCAKCPDDWFTEEDGSGLEFRMAGIVGDDDQIKEDINNPDFDPHTRSASVVFGIPEADVTKEQRRQAKASTFKPLFGGTSGTAGEKRYYASFNERYSGLVKTQERWLAEALATKRVVLPWGMQFYFPWIKMDKSGYVNDRTKIFNAPIQSMSTAEVIPIQAVYLWHYLRNSPIRDEVALVNTVHDSVLAEVQPIALEGYKECVLGSWQEVYSYSESMYGLKLEGLPLGTEITWGTHWGSGEEQAFNVWEDEIKEA